jgi:hypothetical protein
VLVGFAHGGLPNRRRRAYYRRSKLDFHRGVETQPRSEVKWFMRGCNIDQFNDLHFINLE